MSCLDDDLVLELASGGARIDAVIDAHLDSCDACRTLVAQVASTPPAVPGYTLGELLGAGAMGRVYRAVQPGIDREVALKLLPGADLSEAQAMGKLAHPNVIRIYEVGATEDGVYLAMELADGDLRTHRADVTLLRDAARGLAAVHAAGLVHRDVKPANVLVGADGRARIADFGLSAIEGAGTPAYMAPSVRDGAPATAKTDQYSFGATMRDVVRDPPRWLSRVIARCLAMDYADMDAVARALRPPRRWPWLLVPAALVATYLLWPSPPPHSDEAQALTERAHAQRLARDLPAAAKTAGQALATAERAADDEAAAKALLEQTAIAGEQRELREAAQHAAVAAAKIERAGASPELVDEILRQQKLLGVEIGATITPIKVDPRDEVIEGLAARQRGDLVEAEKHLRLALALDRKQHGDIARDLHDLAGVLRLAGKLAEAEPLYREALALETGIDAGLTHNSLALIAMARQDWPAAKLELAAAATLLEDHADLGLVEHNLGLVAFATGDRAGARAHYEKAAAIYARTIGPDAEPAVRLRGDQARAAGRPEEAATKPRDVGAYGARQPW